MSKNRLPLSKRYVPSNGTEGCTFEDAYCSQCIHEKFIHTQKRGDMQCDIYSRALLFDRKDDEYPEEWTYDAQHHPICTAYVNWNWGRDDDDGGFNEPPIIEPIDPSQLSLPFEPHEGMVFVEKKEEPTLQPVLQPYNKLVKTKRVFSILFYCFIR